MSPPSTLLCMQNAYTLPNARMHIRVCICKTHTFQGQAACVCLNSFSQPLKHSATGRPALINYNTPNVQERAGVFECSEQHNAYYLKCWYAFELSHGKHLTTKGFVVCAQPLHGEPVWDGDTATVRVNYEQEQKVSNVLWGGN